MRINIFTLLFSIIISPDLAAAKPERLMTKDEVLALLYPYNLNSDFDDEGFKRREILIHAGEAAFPALEEILLTTDDNVIVGSIANILSGDGAKEWTIPFRAMKKFIELRGHDNPPMFNLHHLVYCLSLVGGPEELRFLRAYSKSLPDDWDKLLVTTTRSSVKRMAERLGEDEPMNAADNSRLPRTTGSGTPSRDDSQANSPPAPDPGPAAADSTGQQNPASWWPTIAVAATLSLACVLLLIKRK